MGGAYDGESADRNRGTDQSGAPVALFPAIPKAYNCRGDTTGALIAVELYLCPARFWPAYKIWPPKDASLSFTSTKNMSMKTGDADGRKAFWTARLSRLQPAASTRRPPHLRDSSG